MKIVCLGDSITLGTPYVEVDETYVSLLHRLLTENGLDAITINSGVGSETTSGSMARFKADVVSRSPACVTIMYGANDCLVQQDKTSPRVALEDFENNLLKMVRLAQSENIAPVLMTTIPFGNKCSWGAWPYYKDRGTNCLVPQYVDCVQKIAKNSNIYLIDNHSMWIDAGIVVDDFTVDGVHPNADGHTLIANTMLPVIRAFLEEKYTK